MTEPVAQRFAHARRDPEVTVLEGFHALKHALRFGAHIEEVVATDPQELKQLAVVLAPDLAGKFEQRAARVESEVLASLAPQAPRTGVMAIARRPFIDVPAALADQRPRPAVLLEDPRNLGNMGACVRVAAAADAAAVLTTGVNDPWHPEAVRGAAGLHYALPVARVTEMDFGDRALLAIDPEGDAFDPWRMPPRAVLAFGTERYGLSDELLSAADARVRIPMREGVSSLNLATAVAAVLFSWRIVGDDPSSQDTA